MTRKMSKKIRMEIPVIIEFERGYRQLELPREVIEKWLSSQKSSLKTKTKKPKRHS